MSTASGKRKVQQTQAGVRLLILLAILICINLLASRFHYGLDLTREKRFTLSKSTKRFLNGMDDVAVVEVYLEGKNHPPEYQRLKDAVRERLQSLKEYAGTHIIYRFVNPFEEKTDAEQSAVFQDLAAKGINAINIGRNENERSVTQLIVPFASVKYKDREVAVALMEYHTGMSEVELLNYSESMLEYKFVSAINQAGKADKPRLAYIMGNGEQLGYHTYDAIKTLSRTYHIDTIDLDFRNIPTVYSAAIICKPTIPFTEKQKFVLDQYIMHGGNLMLMVDGVAGTMDSLVGTEQFLATDNNLNLEDMLFKYGVRVNSNLVEDLQCASIGLQERQMNGEYGNVLKAWYYYPVFVPTSTHPIVKNMDAIVTKLTSSLDTISNEGIQKTVLLETSQYSRTVQSPARVSLSMTRFAPKPELFNKGFQPVAVLMEGKFPSVFQDRIPVSFSAVLDSLKQPFIPSGIKPSKIIVVGDGDIMLNEVSQRNGPVEMGYSPSEGVRYGNKTFFLNCMEYLTDTSGLLEARSKDVRIRLLDGGRLKNEKGKWQMINIIGPLVFVLIFASCYIFFRKRRYEGA
jgi:ABC-2 type transport system permease protein